MLKVWLICGGLSVTGLLVASCSPQSMATNEAVNEATVAATQVAGATTQAIAAATQAMAQGINNPLPGYQGKLMIWDYPTFTLIQRPDGFLILKMKTPPTNQ